MTETLWTICEWTGFIWWCGVIIAGTVTTSGKLLEAALAKWEEDELRRIAWHCPACGRRRGAGCGRDDVQPRVGCYLLGGPPPADDLPANWVEKDVEGSFNDTWSEIRRRRGT